MDNELLTKPPKTDPHFSDQSYLQTLCSSWKNAWIAVDFRVKLILALGIFLAGALQFPTYLRNIQLRKGVMLQDIILDALPAIDVSVPIFTLLYGTLVYMLIKTLKNASLFLLFAMTFVFETVLRMLTIALVPLDPPLSLVELKDPLTEAVVYASNQAITKDLFFSGHTATMVMVWIFLRGKTDKIIGAVACLSLALLLLVQHVHYSADVLAAFAFTFGSYQLANYVYRLPWTWAAGILLAFGAILQIVFVYGKSFQP